MDTWEIHCTRGEHLGVLLQPDLGLKEITGNASKKGRNSFFGSFSTGATGSTLSPLTYSTVYRQVVLPAALYGSELWTSLTSTQMLTLERMQNLCIKVIQGLGKRTRTDMCRSLLGLPRVEAFVMKSALLFLQRLCTLDEDELSKQIFLRRMYQLKLQDIRSPRVTRGICGFLSELLNVHGLSAHLDLFLQTGQFINKMSWKRLVTNQLVTREYSLYETRVQNDPDFVNFVLIHPDCFVPGIAWQVARHIPHSHRVMRFVVSLTTTAPTGTRILCEYCGRLAEDVLIHHCSECSASEVEREHMWDFINNYCDVQFAAYLHNIEDRTFVHTLLGAPLERQDEEDTLIETDCHMLFLYRAACFLYSINDRLSAALGHH